MIDTEELSDEKRAELISECEELKEEISLDGESAEKRVRLANIHLRLGEREEAVMCLQTALLLRPDTPAILSRLRQVCTEEELNSLDLPEKAEPFWRNIPGLFKYPFSGSGVYLLVGGTVFVTIMQFIISLPTLFFFASILVSIFLAGYISSYFISVMRTSARGYDTPPDWPDITDLGGSIGKPIVLVSFAGIVSFFPAVGYLIYSVVYGGRISVLVGLIALGALYYPMALIASVMTGAALNSANFAGVLTSIFRVPKEYLAAEITLAFFAVLSVMAYFMVAAISTTLPGTVVGVFASRFVYLYFLMIYARILGLLYRQCKSKIAA